MVRYADAAPASRINGTSAPRMRRRSRETQLYRPSEKLGGIAIALLVMLVLAPLPFGSNRPFFWGLWAVYAAGIGLLYAVMRWRVGAGFAYSAQRIRVAVTLFFAVAAFMAVQALPLGTFTFASGNGHQFTSAYLSLTPGETWLALMRWLTYGTVFFLMLQVAVPARRSLLLLQVILISVVCYALFGLLALMQLGDQALIFPKWAYLGSSTGPFVNRNSFATYLGMGACIALAFLVAPPAESDRSVRLAGQLWHFMALLVIVSSLIATQSRMGVMATIVGACVTSMLARTRGDRVGAAKYVATAIPVSTLVVVVVVYGQGLMERLGNLEGDADDRFQLYAQVWDMIVARPLAGYGAGSFELAFPLFHRLPVSLEVVWNRAHSTYLSLWMELGVLFGSMAILVFAILIVQIIRRDSTCLVQRSAAVGATATAAAHSTVDFSLEIHAVALLVAAMLGIGLSAGSRQRHQTGDTAGVASEPLV